MKLPEFLAVKLAVGKADGINDIVEFDEGEKVGDGVGGLVGVRVGSRVGMRVGGLVGVFVGVYEGDFEGGNEGLSVSFGSFANTILSMRVQIRPNIIFLVETIISGLIIYYCIEKYVKKNIAVLFSYIECFTFRIDRK